MRSLGTTLMFWLFSSCLVAATFVVDSTTVMLRAGQGDLTGIQPGDSILLLPGTYHNLFIADFEGTRQNPIIISNHPSGKAIIASDHYYGISISRSRYLHVRGNGSPNHFYGIEVTQVNGNGLGASKGSYGITVSHVHIHDISGSGIQVKTDATCNEFHRDSLIIYDIELHHNHIENVGLEGFYIGSTKYSGHSEICNGSAVTLLDPLLQHVRIYNNTFIRTGWDALQVAGAFDVEVYGNSIKFDSRAKVANQMSGIAIGAGCIPIVYNNSITDGNGNGISSFGMAGQRIFNNIIERPGENDSTETVGHGIYMSDKEDATPIGQTYVVNNTILWPQKGIKISNQYTDSSQVIVSNNLIMDPYSKAFYESINQPERAYMQTPRKDVVMQNNIFLPTVEGSWFEQVNSTDYSPAFASPMVDAGAETTYSFLQTDFNGNSRSNGYRVDAGAVESPYFFSGINDAEQNKAFRFDNPVIHQQWHWKIRGFTPGIVRIQLFDIAGNQMQEWFEMVTTEDHQFVLDIRSSLPSGVYPVKINTKAFEESGLVIIP